MNQDTCMKVAVYAVVAIIVILVVRYYLNKENFANEHKHHEHKHHEHKHKPVAESTQPHELYGIGGQNHTIWKTNAPCVNGQCQWTEIPGALKYISNGTFDIWGAGPGAWAPIWKCDKPCTGNWQNVPGSLATVTVGEGYVYGVNDNGQIFQCPHSKEAPCTGQWTEISGYLEPGGVVSA